MAVEHRPRPGWKQILPETSKKKSTERIDGIVATVMGLGQLAHQAPQCPDIYFIVEGRGALPKDAVQPVEEEQYKAVPSIQS